jgi:ribosomal protein L12E/L44/L45/RPP1/RPP2
MSDTEFAKTQLREHLGGLLNPPISEGFWSIYTNASDLCKRNDQPDQVLRTFQNMLTKIPEWTGATLTTEVERIVKTTKCTYLDDLLMGVFISYMKSFASLHYKGASSHVNVDFERPSVEKFVHEFYIYSARQLWQVAYLFKTIGVSSEQQARNRKEIDSLINESLEHVIRAFLPWQSIAKQFAQSQEETPVEEQKPRHVEFDEDSDEEEEEEEKQPPIEISDDVATIEVETIGEEDPMKEIERKVESELVLKL